MTALFHYDNQFETRALMEPPQLPDDVNRWPRDPYRLFGVSPGVGKKELRKAYTLLIRRFKPERFPEQFRRIRDAYEFLLEFSNLPNPFGGGMPNMTPWNDPSRMPNELHSPSVDIGESEPPPRSEPIEVETTNLGPLWPTSQLELDAAWQNACKGDGAAAYGEVSKMALEHPSQTEFLLAAYWLLVAFPDVDNERTTIDWLAKGIRSEGCTGIWRDLFARELYHHPKLATRDAVGDLLHVMNSPAQLANVAGIRWSALEQTDDWETMARDLVTLRPRLWREDDKSWIRLLLAACDFTAWPTSMTARKLFDRCREEIEEITHLHEMFREDLSRLDYLVEVSQAWHGVSGREDIPRDFLQLIPMAWTHPFAEARLPLYRTLTSLVQTPNKTLKFFDRLQITAPSVLAQFGNLLAQLERERKDQISPYNPNTCIARWLNRAKPGSRPQLLAFCLAEGVSPNQIADFGDLRHIDPEWMFTIRNDVPMQLLCKGHQLFWS